ncbi:MAG: alpha/beta hydrolase [Tannerella sp.]|jgi:acetyl esterase/lipase|nr:alpha/beta hydrolase [Tannerella sp.]
MKLLSNIGLLLFCFVAVSAQNVSQADYVLREDLSYIEDSETDEYRRSRCKLDVYYPVKTKGFSTVVWFHGGGLEGGGKHIPAELKNKGIAVVTVNYRLSPKAENPAYIVDAAEATAWAFKNIEKYGGDPDKIFVAGHSAGGYLALMVGLDKKYMASYGVDADKIKGLIPISGQTNTHYTIRKERGLPWGIPVIDEYAPINCVRKNLPSTLLVTGDRTMEMTARFEENLHLKAIMASMGNDVELYELQGFDHGNVLAPSGDLILRFIAKHTGSAK